MTFGSLMRECQPFGDGIDGGDPPPRDFVKPLFLSESDRTGFLSLGISLVQSTKATGLDMAREAVGGKGRTSNRALLTYQIQGRVARASEIRCRHSVQGNCTLIV